MPISGSQGSGYQLQPQSSGEQVFQSDAFVDSVGIATHLVYTDTPYYKNWSQVLSSLQTLGVRHVRDGFYPWSSSDPIVQHHQALAGAGIGTTYVVPTETSHTSQMLETFAGEVQDMDALESPNECNAASNCGSPEFMLNGKDVLGMASRALTLLTASAGLSVGP